MAKYRKRPVIVEVEAEQYIAGQTIPKGVHTDIWNKQPHIHTSNGVLQVSDGDWIITDSYKRKRPCKPDIFEQTYEKVIE